MKKLLLVLVLILLSTSVFAVGELEVQDVIFNEPVEAGSMQDIEIHIENVGDDPINTGLPHIISFTQESERGYSALYAYTGREGDAVQPIEINGEMVMPVFGEVSYVERDPADDRNGPVLEPYAVTKEMYYVTLQPGDVAVFRTAETLTNYQIYFPINGWSLDETTVDLNVLFYAEGSANKQWFTKEVTVMPTVTQVDSEYQAKYMDSGCVVLKGKDVCIDVEDESVIFSVDGESEEFGLYNLFMNWINKVFGDGAISSWLNVGDVQIKLYEDYLRIQL